MLKGAVKREGAEWATAQISENVCRFSARDLSIYSEDQAGGSAATHSGLRVLTQTCGRQSAAA